MCLWEASRATAHRAGSVINAQWPKLEPCFYVANIVRLVTSTAPCRLQDIFRVSRAE